MPMTRLNRFIPALLLLVALTPQVRAQTGVIGVNFTALTSADTGFIPPDTAGGVSETNLALLVNGRYRAFDKTGLTVANRTLTQFWNDAGVSQVSDGGSAWAFDPRITYDAAAGRWYASAVHYRDGNNSYLLAVSNASDLAAGWTGFRWDADAANVNWADFPMLGFDADAVYLSANMFAITDNDFAGRQTYAIAKSDLFSATPTVANRVLFTDSDGSTGGQPATAFDGTGLADHPMSFWDTDHLAAAVVPPGERTNAILLSQITGSFATGLSMQAQPDITPGQVLVDPKNGRQPDGTRNLMVDPNRFSGTLVRRGDSVWGVEPRQMPGVGVADVGVRWFEFDADTGAILQEGVVQVPSLDMLYPSIAVNAAGDVVIGFSATGPDAGEFPSAYAVVGDTDLNGVTTFGAPMILKAGTASYHRTDSKDRNRWGDYSTTVSDPTSDFIFWTFQEYATGATTWAVQTTQIIIARDGDVNTDGYIDSLDINELHAALQAGSGDLRFDVDGDGSVDSGDMLQLVVGLLGHLPGDATLNGAVNLDDLARLQNNWLGSGKDFLDGDFTGNGIVNLDDLAVLQNHWLQTGASPANPAAFPLFHLVPEPSVAMTLLPAMAVLALRRRKSISRAV